MRLPHELDGLSDLEEGELCFAGVTVVTLVSTIPTERHRHRTRHSRNDVSGERHAPPRRVDLLAHLCPHLLLHGLGLLAIPSWTHRACVVGRILGRLRVAIGAPIARDDDGPAALATRHGGSLEARVAAAAPAAVGGGGGARRGAVMRRAVDGLGRRRLIDGRYLGDGGGLDADVGRTRPGFGDAGRGRVGGHAGLPLKSDGSGAGVVVM